MSETFQFSASTPPLNDKADQLETKLVIRPDHTRGVDVRRYINWRNLLIYLLTYLSL